MIWPAAPPLVVVEPTARLAVPPQAPKVKAPPAPVV